LLNHLLVYSLVQTGFLVAYVSIWQSTLSQIGVALVEMMSSEFICVFWLRWESYAYGGLLNVIYSLMPILAHGYLLIILLWSPYVDSHLFVSLGMVMNIIAQIHSCMPCEAP
jgi:hypothetical protein